MMSKTSHLTLSICDSLPASQNSNIIDRNHNLSLRLHRQHRAVHRWRYKNDTGKDLALCQTGPLAALNKVGSNQSNNKRIKMEQRLVFHMLDITPDKLQELCVTLLRRWTTTTSLSGSETANLSLPKILGFAGW